MDTTRSTAPRKRSLLEIAYDRSTTPSWKRRDSALPGPLYDITVIGIFLVLAVGYFLPS